MAPMPARSRGLWVLPWILLWATPLRADPTDAAPPDPPKLLPGAAPDAEPPPAPQQPAPREPAAASKPPRDPDIAVVTLHVTYPGAWLELKDLMTRGSFERVCSAPCGLPIRVAASEARVTAPDMTASNVFRIDPGSGTARLRIEGGSKSYRDAGLIALSVGIPVTLTGMGILGYGRLKESSTLTTTGIVVLVAGGVAVLGSLPLLAAGKTRVRDGEGRVIASRPFAPAF